MPKSREPLRRWQATTSGHTRHRMFMSWANSFFHGPLQSSLLPRAWLFFRPSSPPPFQAPHGCNRPFLHVSDHPFLRARSHLRLPRFFAVISATACPVQEKLPLWCQSFFFSLSQPSQERQLAASRAAEKLANIFKTGDESRTRKQRLVLSSRMWPTRNATSMTSAHQR